MTSDASSIDTRLAALTAGFPQDLFVTEVAAMEGYSHDWSGDHSGIPLAVARPRTASILADLVKRCAEQGLPLVPQGGLTGLVGAATAEPDRREVVVSLERMAAVRSVDPLDYAMVVEAGCVLEVAKRAAAEAGCLLPITFGAQGSCRIGGNVSTNAGGFNVLRYGMTRDLVLGLEVVLADGRIWNGLRTLRKDNRGYDLKQLFIGAEGTLGIVTAAALKLFPKPVAVEVALVAFHAIADAMDFYAHARRACSDLLSAFELILRPGLEVAMRPPAGFPEPLSTPYPAYVLMEVAASGPVDLRRLVEDCLAGFDRVADGTIAASQAQAERLWLYREMMVEHQGRGGRYYRSDVSVPISRMAEFLAAALADLKTHLPDAEAIAYGHVGDGNLHLNVVPPAGLAESEVDRLFERAQGVLFALLPRFGGSISAEHGIGRLKRAAYLAGLDPVTRDLAEGVKSLLDPLRILSPGRILPGDGPGSREGSVGAGQE